MKGLTGISQRRPKHMKKLLIGDYKYWGLRNEQDKKLVVGNAGK